MVTAPAWSLSALPRVKVVSCLVRQDTFVPSRRFRDDDLEDLKLSMGGGARVNALGAPAVAKQTKPFNSDCAGLSGACVVYTLRENDSDFGGHVARLMLLGALFFTGLSWTEHRSWREFYTLF